MNRKWPNFRNIMFVFSISFILISLSTSYALLANYTKSSTTAVNILEPSTYEDLQETKRLKGNIISDYPIESLKIEINADIYYISLNQALEYSFYDELEAEIQDLFANLDYEAKNIIEISVKFDTSESNLQDEFIKILTLTNKDYKIELKENHDAKMMIDENQKIIVLDKLFSIEAFKEQLVLASNLGNLSFDFSDFDKVPNASIIKVIDNETEKVSYIVIVKGDVNNNASITITDVILASYYSLGAADLDENQKLAADLNNNGAITITDVYLIALKSLEDNA